MIYTRKTKFSYPIFMNVSNDYRKPEFIFDVNLTDNSEEYVFNIEYKISSKFLNNLLARKLARIYLIVKSRDNQYHELSDKKTVIIKKNRLSLEKSKTVLQLMIQADMKITFADNTELNEFYDEYKDKIVVESGMALGFSDIITFDGSQKKPFDLFERKLDPDIKGNIEIQLTDETIVIVYRNEEARFYDFGRSKELNCAYLYIGLQKALVQFISNYVSRETSVEEGVRLDMIAGNTVNALDSKLYNLMVAKGIEEVSLNNMDEVIYLITNNMMDAYISTVRGLYNGN